MKKTFFKTKNTLKNRKDFLKRKMKNRLFKKQKKNLKRKDFFFKEKCKKGFLKSKKTLKKDFKKQTLASSSTFLYSVQKGLYNEAMQSKLGQSLTNHQGVNTLRKNK